MWTRSLLKKNAWASLKNYYWPALGVTVLASIMGANNGGGISFGGGSRSTDYTTQYSDQHGDVDPAFVIGLIVGIVAVVTVALLLSLALKCFVGNVALCGQCKYFVTARNGDQKFGHMFDNFKGGNYMPTVKTMFFWMGEIWLWSLLFIIPGIIKSYEYALVPYLVAENPHIDRKRAKEISRQTMEGEKWNYFVLQLSFIGWYLLGYLACCIGVVAVVPYQKATEAEFYMCMRAKMLSYGYTTEDELTGGFFNGMSGNAFDTSSYNEPNFQNNAYNVSGSGYQNPYDASQNNYNAPQNNYNAPQNPYGAPPVNPNDQYNGQMPGISDDNDQNPQNPYNT